MRKFRLLLIFSIFAVEHYAFSDTPPGPERGSTFIFLPTNRQAEFPNGDQALRIDTGEIPLESVGNLVETSGPVLIDGFEEIEVAIWMPKGISIAKQDAFCGAIQGQLVKKYSKIKIIRRFLDIGKLEDDVKAANADLEQASKDQANIVSPETLAMMREANTRQVADAKSWAKRFREIVFFAGTPKINLIFGRSLSFVRAGISAVAWVSSVGFNLPGVALSILDPVSEYLNTRYQAGISRWIRVHQLASWIPFVKIYNRAEIAKSYIYQVALFSVVLPGFRRELFHLNDPEGAESVFNSDFLWESLAEGMVGTFLYSVGEKGLDSSRLKGHISLPFQRYMLWGASLFFQATCLLHAKGRYELLPFTLGAEYSIYLMSYTISKILPTKNNRFVFYDPLLKNKIEDIKEFEGIEASINIKNQTIDELVVKLEKIQPIVINPKGLAAQIRRGFAASLDRVGRFLGACQNLILSTTIPPRSN